MKHVNPSDKNNKSYAWLDNNNIVGIISVKYNKYKEAFEKELKSLETLKEVASGEANKVFIPFDATSALSSLGAIKEVMKDKK